MKTKTKSDSKMRRMRRERVRRSDRRGITLLFVISMIVLFLLMGTTFVIVSNDFFRASKKRAVKEVHKVDGTPLLEQSFAMLVRGPAMDNLNSPLRGTDLMSDQYGYGLKAFVAQGPAAPAFTGNSSNQMVTFLLTSDSVNFVADGQAFSVVDPTAAAGPIPAVDHNYEGQVLSFVSGPAKGHSTRILRHQIVDNAGTQVHQITIPWLALDALPAPALLEESEVIINGQDFAGGIVAGGDELLFPNRRGEPLATFLGTYMNASPLAFNEDWDAPDGNNLFLSGFRQDGSFIPSFYREAQEAFITNGGLTSATGSQPTFYAFNDSPDVDADRDGVEDSFWMDVGFSVQSNGDGVYYKPLVAYHVVDLDGRLNVNAHGNASQAQADRFINTFSPTLGAASAMAAGQGYGPAELELGEVFANGLGIASDVVLSNVLQSRYAGLTNDGLPGTGSAARTRSKLFGSPFDTVDWTNGRFGTRGNNYASSSMDIGGRFKVVVPPTPVVNTGSTFDNFIDPNYGVNFPNAMPIIDMLASTDTVSAEIQISPYEMSFASSPYNDSSDSPFTEFELERVLRPYDADSALLPSRLWTIADPADPNRADQFWITDGTVANRNRLVTTRSFEVPVIPRSIVTKVRQQIADVNGITLAGATPAQLEAIRLVTNQLLERGQDYCFAPELSRKLKMDLNRPFGNGYDNNSSGVVDDPSESLTEVNIDQGGVPMDLNNDGIPQNVGDANARVEFARHLYMLTLLLTGEPALDLDGSGGHDPADVLIYKRMIAQWAVNVVDFRDADSIMTRFPYDPNPWDGWAPTEEVWGCERPELLLTETLAAHARRTEDLAVPGGDTGGGDTDFDQRLRPEPFAYFELYNPWTQNSLNQVQDASLYDANQGVDLGRSAGGSPVWRIEVERPERVDGLGNPIPSAIVRYVYMTDDTAAIDSVGDDDLGTLEVFFPSAAPGSVRPGANAVIGTLGIEDPANAGSFRSFFGRLNSKTVADEAASNLELDITNQIIINPGAGEITGFPVDTVNNPRFATIVPIDQGRVGTAAGAGSPRKFSLSDPFGGYPDVDSGGTAITDIPDGDGAEYTVPFDTPLDALTDANRDPSDRLFIQSQDGMAQDFRVVRLQRLANPLLPWDGLTNPYLTIDTMEVDLITFNGVVSSASEDTFRQPANNGTTDVGGVPFFANRSVSLERGQENVGQRSLFGFQRNGIRAGTPGVGDHFFNVNPTQGQTIGKTNDSFEPGVPGNTDAFAWLTWNNRPFANQMELMNVPFLAPDELTYTPAGSTRASFTIDNAAITDPYNNLRPNSIAGRYGHLLNFFARDTGGADIIPDFYRLLEYTEVPSRFAGTEALLTISQQAQNPFNFVSRYRVPGKINLNTMPNVNQVWLGVNAEFSAVTNLNEVRASMLGANLPTPTVSTDFINPFRASESSDNLMSGSGSTQTGSEVTLMRAELANPGTPLFDFVSADPTHDTDRNAYFRNAMRQRLGNMVTTRSSVFAIWVTVGYFEVDENGDLRPGPTGEGIEVGAETGEAQRHRGFYIFDRSIPMAFEPGKNHNIERGILVKSVIE